jgi:light-regulated signal transduction histidine kinase (bacteriophytochrome)
MISCAESIEEPCLDLSRYSSAMLNILADISEENVRLSAIQKAMLNLLEDINAEMAKNEQVSRAMANEIAERKVVEESLRQANAIALTANKELEAFSYSVSHDLRAPLRAVDGFSRLMMDGYGSQLDDEGRRMLNVIHDETLRMSRLVDELLAFTRLGQQQMESSTVDMTALARDVFDGLQALEPERQLQFNLQSLPPAFGVSAMIRQVWVNLISNAVKFTRDRPIGVIEIAALVGEDGQWVYHVKDNGAGFDMRFANKLFCVFQRLHGADEYPGVGVGLALAQRIIQRHGGRIWAEGEVGKGATFYFTLPKPMNPPSTDKIHPQPQNHHE